VSEIAAVLIGGPPATGKSTLAMALAPRLDAAVLDLDVATAPLTRVVSELTGLHDLDDPALAGLTRDARYDTLLDLAAANLAAARPVVLVAPFTLERSRVSAWAATAKRIPAPATMVWLYLPPGELVRRLTERGLARDESKLRDPASYLTGLDLEPPVVPHLALDASRPTAALVSSVLDHLSRQGALRGVGFPAKARYGGWVSPPRRVTSGLADAFSLLYPSCDTDIAADHGYCV
jgi:predicted kinase